MTIKRTVFNKAADLAIAALGMNRPIRAYRAFLSRINAVKKVEVNGTTILFDANDELHLLRASWIHDKEPETLAWIDSFSKGDVFYDVGANVGVFSLYAALHQDCDVYAFEPEAKNYACLNKNVYLNRLGRRVKALNVGLHDSTRIEFLHLHDLSSGAALHALGEPVDWQRNRFEAKFEQAVLAFALDDFVREFKVPQPNHVKIDVDGNEEKIICGARSILSAPTLKSLLIELSDSDGRLVQLIESCGLTLQSKAPATTLGPHGNVVNAVFVRNSRRFREERRG